MKIDIGNLCTHCGRDTSFCSVEGHVFIKFGAIFHHVRQNMLYAYRRSSAVFLF